MSDRLFSLCICMSLLGVAIGCTPGTSDDPYLGATLEWESDSLHYYRSNAVAPACAGVSEYLDAYADTLRTRFSAGGSAEVSFVYASSAELPCSSIACTKANIVYSTEAVHEHELVHGVRSFAGFSHLVIEEGAAEFLGDDSRKYASRFDTDGAIREAADAIDAFLPPEFYGRAGRFYSLLTEQSSPDELVDLLSATNPSSSTQELSDALASTTGQGLQEWSDAFAEYEVCDQATFRDATPMCEVVSVAPRCDGADAVVIEKLVECSEPEVLGPRDGEIWSYLAVEIPAAGQYGVFVDALGEELEATLSIKSCSAGCGSFFREFEVPSALTPATAVELRAGTYLLRVGVRDDAGALFRIVISGADCQ